MANYRLYYIEDARLKGADEIEASDDLQALAVASDRTTTHLKVEVWRGGRKICEAPAG
jgi:hypothetical protein